MRARATSRRRRATVASAVRYESDLYKAALSEMQVEQRRLEQQIVDERAEIDVRRAFAFRRVLSGARGTKLLRQRCRVLQRSWRFPYGNKVLLKGVQFAGCSRANESALPFRRAAERNVNRIESWELAAASGRPESSLCSGSARTRTDSPGS